MLIGVLEQPQCGKKKEISARILFYKEGTRWNALDVRNQSYWNINSNEWTIAFDGKNLGTVELMQPKENKKYTDDWLFRKDKTYEIKSTSTLPKISNKSKQFSGWCDAPDFRPLIIVSKPNYEDPEKWKPFEASASCKEMLFPFLRVSIGRLNYSMRCDYEQTNNLVPYDFKALETVIYKSYRSSTDKEIISIGIDLKKINCDGPRPAEWSGNWFLINKQEVDFIGREMELIDAGDYDGDGKSEFLFWRSGYDRDGYILIYNNFRESAEYFWSYH